MTDHPTLTAVLTLAAELRRLPPPYVEARCGHPVYAALLDGVAELEARDLHPPAIPSGQIGDPAAIPIVIDPDVPDDEVHLLDAAGGRTVVRFPTRRTYVQGKG